MQPFRAIRRPQVRRTECGAPGRISLKRNWRWNRLPTKSAAPLSACGYMRRRRRRADLFARLGEYSGALGAYASQAVNRAELTKQVMSLMGRYFDWPVAALLEPVGGEMTRVPSTAEGRRRRPCRIFAC